MKNSMLVQFLTLCLFLFSFADVYAQANKFLTDADRLNMLVPPQGKVDVVFDTDTYNEIDDQFALVYALLSQDKLNIKAVYAAPFSNYRSTGAGDGMEKSYEEILRIFKFMNISSVDLVYRGSNEYIKDLENPVKSDAAEHLVNLAKNYSKENPLIVMAVGAITNVASAILIDPSITSKIVVVWLGGNGHKWHNPKEFNYRQDLLASRTIFDCGVPFVQIPCTPITTHLTTTIPEMEYYLKDKGPIAEYLLKIFNEYHPEWHKVGYSKVIWDMTAIAWVVNSNWIQTEIVHSPLINENYTYTSNTYRHLMSVAKYVNRDGIFGDFFTKLNSTQKN